MPNCNIILNDNTRTNHIIINKSKIFFLSRLGEPHMIRWVAMYLLLQKILMK